MWNGKFDLPDGSYYVSDIQNYLSTLLNKSTMKSLIMLQKEYMEKKLRIESHLKLKKDTILSF